MIICTTDEVKFPKDRKAQHEGLEALAGDALLRGDAVAWKILFNAAQELKRSPEYDSPLGREVSERVRQQVRGSYPENEPLLNSIGNILK